MRGTLLIGDGREIRQLPDDAFVRAMDGMPARMASRLAFFGRHAARHEAAGEHADVSGDFFVKIGPCMAAGEKVFHLG